MGGQADGPRLVEISRRECFRLLASIPIGRVAVGRGAEPPLVVPVNYAVDGELIVFRTDPGAKLFLLRVQPISFQADLIDPSRRAGWSVLVQGVAYEALPEEIAHLRVEQWTGGSKEHWIRLAPTSVTGRRIEHHPTCPNVMVPVEAEP